MSIQKTEALKLWLRDLEEAKKAVEEVEKNLVSFLLRSFVLPEGVEEQPVIIVQEGKIVLSFHVEHFPGNDDEKSETNIYLDTDPEMESMIIDIL